MFRIRVLLFSALVLAAVAPAVALNRYAPVAPGGIDRVENALLYVEDGRTFLFSLVERRLTDLHCRGWCASFSPDGTAIAFRGFGYSNDYGIYVMRADGSGRKRLTNDGSVNFYPAWSPDGRKIVYVSGHFDPNRDCLVGHVYVINADGTAPVRLTDEADEYYLPTWSPAGDRVVVMRDPNGAERIIVLYVGAAAQAPAEVARGIEPRWSPDGRKLAFEYRHRLAVVAVAEPTSSAPLDLGPGGDAAWSPDGRKLAFSSGGHVVIVDAANPALMPRTDLGRGYRPAWSPDGSKVIYSVTEAGRSVCCIVNADGGAVARFPAPSPLDYSFSPLRIGGVLYDTYGHVIKE